MVSRRRFLQSAVLASLPASGCLDGTVGGTGRTEEPETATQSAADGTGPEHATTVLQEDSGAAPTTQFQYDPRNTGVVDSAVPTGATQRWRTRLDPAEGGVAVSGDTVIVAARSLVALDTADGEERWRADVGHSLAAPPTVTADTAYVAAWNGGESVDRGVVAVDLADGSERWRAIPEVDVNSPLTLADGTVYAGGSLNSHEVVALDADDGAVQWRFTAGQYASTAAVADGVAYVGGGESRATYALDAETGEQLWEFESTGPVWAAPTVRDDTVYVATRHGRVYALDPATGERLWRTTIGEGVDQSVAATDDSLFVSAGGSLVSLSTDGDERWSVDLGSDAFVPTVADDSVVVTDNRRAYGFDPTDGEERWRHDVRERRISDMMFVGVESPPVVADATVYLVSHGGDVVALADEES